MNNFYKGGRGLAFSQREGEASFPKAKPPRLSKTLIPQCTIESVGLPYHSLTSVENGQASHLTTTLEQPKNDLRITQQRPKVDPSLSLAQPSLSPSYRQGSPKDCTRSTQETANNDPRNVRVMYRECTVSVRGEYRKGTREVLKRYWRATKDILNACTSGVDQRYSKYREMVQRKASHNRSRIKCLKPIAYGLQLIICFMLFNLSTAWAQSRDHLGAAEGHTKIQPLKIGDTIPEELWHLPLQVVNHPEGQDTITLNDYRDKKLIILDFWATWCGACIASFPRMHDLEIEMADKVKILAITTQSDSIVRNFLDRGSSPHLEALKEHFYSAVNAKYLRQLFRSASIPHVVVIDQRGVVRARTTPSVLSVNNLLDIAENPFSAPIPMAIEEITSPLMKPTFGERDRPMYYSGLYPFSHTLPYIQHTNVDSRKGITQFFYTNAPVIQLFSAALKYAPDYVNGLATIPSRRIFEVSQPELFDDRLSDENLVNWYAYESVSPLGTADEVIRNRMINDLEFYLGLEAVYEERNVKCLVLRIANLAHVPVNKETGSASELVIDGRTRGDGTTDGRFEQDVIRKQMPANSYAYNFKLDRLAYTLNRTMRLGIPYIIDETGLGDPVNLVLPDNLSNIEDLQRTLSEQGLRLDYENRRLTMFVLKEKGYTRTGQDMVMNTFGYVYGSGEEDGK